MPWNPDHYNMKKQNPIAKEVRTPQYKQRIVKDKTVYDRKKTSMNEILEVGEPAPDFTGTYTPPDDMEEDDEMRLGAHLCDIDAVEKLKYDK